MQVQVFFFFFFFFFLMIYGLCSDPKSHLNLTFQSGGSDAVAHMHTFNSKPVIIYFVIKFQFLEIYYS